MNGISLTSEKPILEPVDLVFPRVFLSVDNPQLGKLPRYPGICNECFIVAKTGISKISSVQHGEFLLPTTEARTAALRGGLEEAMEDVRKQENNAFLDLLEEATRGISPKSTPDIRYGHYWRNLLINDNYLGSIENWDMPNITVHASPSAPEGVAYMFCDPYSVGVYHLRQDYTVMQTQIGSYMCYLDIGMAIFDNHKIDVYRV